jgi:hypothetical protein
VNKEITYNIELVEEDFYPAHDNRTLQSYIRDVRGGDSFEEYAEYIFDLYEEEGYYEN